MKKKILLTLALLLVGNISSSYGQMVDYTEYKIPLSSSVNLKKITENYGNSSNVFNIIEADLNDANNSLDIVFNTQGLFKTMSIKEVTDSNENIVATVNTDFFLMQTPTSSIGAMVKNGKVLSSPAEAADKYASMIITKSGKVSFEYIQPGVVIRNLSTGNNMGIATMNKVISSSYTGNTIRTSDYAYTTFGKNDKNPDRVEVIVGSDMIVQEIRQAEGSTQIPYGGFAIISFNTNGSDLLNSFKVGDKLEITMNILMNRPDIKTIIGGGSLLIKNGQKTDITMSVKGNSQRTAVGLTKDNKLIIFTNDGRLSASPGLSEQEVQNYLLSIGVADAIMFDGGGSTQLYADGKAQNHIESERKVINALVLKNENQTGNIDKLNLTVLKDIIYIGDSVEVIASAQDINGSKITKYDTSKASLTTTGFNSTINSRTIVPVTAGKGSINATISGVTATVEVEVLDSFASDEKNKENTSEVKKFNIYSNMYDANDLISQVVKSKMIEKSDSDTTNLVIGNTDTYFSNNLKGISQNINTSTANKIFENTIVVSLNNTSNIFKVSSQWNNLKTALESNSKNVIIAMQGGSKLSTALEQEAFDKLLESVAKEKNIYLVYKSDKNEAYKRGNVSYMSIIDLSRQNYIQLQNVKYIQMYEDKSGVLIYNYKTVF